MMKSFKVLLALLILLSCITSSVVIVNEVETYDDLSVDYLKENSEICVLICTEIGNYEFNGDEKEYTNLSPIDPNEVTVEKNGDYYITLFAVQRASTLSDIEPEITIVQRDKQIIKKNGMYFVFLNKIPGEDNCYELSCGESSVIFLKDGQKLQPMDKRLKYSFKYDVGESVPDFDKWMCDNYDYVSYYRK